MTAWSITILFDRNHTGVTILSLDFELKYLLELTFIPIRVPKLCATNSRPRLLEHLINLRAVRMYSSAPRDAIAGESRPPPVSFVYSCLSNQCIKRISSRTWKYILFWFHSFHFKFVSVITSLGGRGILYFALPQRDTVVILDVKNINFLLW